MCLRTNVARWCPHPSVRLRVARATFDLILSIFSVRKLAESPLIPAHLARPSVVGCPHSYNPPVRSTLSTTVRRLQQRVGLVRQGGGGRSRR
jgi:hypothetical protein